jgi:protein-S-isoprenylcysteine O-methyltransferase Ste14
VYLLDRPGRNRSSLFQMIYRFRGFLVSPPLLFSLVWFRSELEFDVVILPIGLCIYFIGIAIRIWAQQHLHYRLKIKKKLTITGPYQFVRNPIYIGNTFICIGLTIISEVVWLVPITFIWCAMVYSMVVRYEEACLLKKYGQLYQTYVSEVPRWFPRNLRFRSLGLKNEFFYTSIFAEIHCIVFLLPFILKEMVFFWFEH